jgi:hypothetical protein
MRPFGDIPAGVIFRDVRTIGLQHHLYPACTSVQRSVGRDPSVILKKDEDRTKKLAEMDADAETTNWQYPALTSRIAGQKKGNIGPASPMSPVYTPNADSLNYPLL